MIALRISLTVDRERWSDVERVYGDVFLPALRRQEGFRGSSLYRVFAEPVGQGGGGAEPADHVVELRFASEADRRRWAASEDHAAAWPQVRGLASAASSVGYDVLVTEACERVATGVAEAP